MASPVSMLPGYAKWLRGASRYTMYRTSAFAELFGVPHEAKIHHLRKKRCSIAVELSTPSLFSPFPFPSGRKDGLKGLLIPFAPFLFPIPDSVFSGPEVFSKDPPQNGSAA